MTVALVLAWPLASSEPAQRELDAITRRAAVLGDQVLGFDVTAPRQNIFSLARDLRRATVVIDHGTVRRSRLLGLANFVSRGAVSTVADALRWYRIPLTKRQARTVPLCARIAEMRTNEPIVIQPDPYQYGVASWYGPGFHGQVAASGEVYDMYGTTAAHQTLPMQSLVRVVSQHSDRTVVVRINDRGPYANGRIIDLSYAAKKIIRHERSRRSIS